jgi:hypothetical protein
MADTIQVAKLQVLIQRAIPCVQSCIGELDDEIDYEYSHTTAQQAIVARKQELERLLEEMEGATR